MIRAVLDSGVLVSGFAPSRRSMGAPKVVVRRWLAGEFTLQVSEPILEEFERTMATKPYFTRRVAVDQRVSLVARLRRRSVMISDLVLIPGVAPHWHDDVILATVAASGADWFVTGDRKLLAMRAYAGVPFTDPQGFLAALDAAR